jgi:MFS family permease
VVSQGISESTSIVLVGVMSLAGIISAASGGYFSDKYGNKRWLTLIYGIMVILLLLFTYAKGIRTITGIAIIYGFIRTMDMGASASLIADVSTDKRRSKAYGMYFLPVYVLGAFIPILAAYVAEQTDISSVFILASIFMFLGVIVLQKVSSEKKVKNKNLKEE